MFKQFSVKKSEKATIKKNHNRRTRSKAPTNVIKKPSAFWELRNRK